jgi:hypothetical protein
MEARRSKVEIHQDHSQNKIAMSILYPGLIAGFFAIRQLFARFVHLTATWRDRWTALKLTSNLTPYGAISRSVQALTNIIFLLRSAPSDAHDTELYLQLAEKELERLRMILAQRFQESPRN